MPYKNKADKQAWRRKYRASHGSEIQAYGKKYYVTHKEESQAYNKRYRPAQRIKIIKILGGVCVKCGFSDPRALQIDHQNGGGVKDRKRRGMYAIIKDILEGNIKPYQLLCANCNWIKRYENNENAGKAHSLS